MVDAAGQSLPPNTGGLLALKRPFPHMLRTVYNAPERYEEAWTEVPGLYLTGDIAVRDEAGRFSVLGRADDVLNVSGHRIGTADVESALVSHEAVAESAVVGVPDDIKGEVIKALRGPARRFYVRRRPLQNLDFSRPGRTRTYRYACGGDLCRRFAQNPERQNHAPTPQSSRVGARPRRLVHARDVKLQM